MHSWFDHARIFVGLRERSKRADTLSPARDGNTMPTRNRCATGG
jgi:hypothetical protein